MPKRPLIVLFLFVVSLAAGLAARAEEPEWIREDQAAAFARAQAEDKLVLVDIWAEWCGWCKKLDADVFPTPEFAAAAESFVLLKVDSDANEGYLEKTGQSGLPTTAFFLPDGTLLASRAGYMPTEEYIAMLEQAKDLRTKAGVDVATLTKDDGLALVSAWLGFSNLERAAAVIASLKERALLNDAEAGEADAKLAKAYLGAGKVDEGAALLVQLEQSGSLTAEQIAENQEALFIAAFQASKPETAAAALESLKAGGTLDPEKALQFEQMAALCWLRAGNPDEAVKVIDALKAGGTLTPDQVVQVDVMLGSSLIATQPEKANEVLSPYVGVPVGPLTPSDKASIDRVVNAIVLQWLDPSAGSLVSLLVEEGITGAVALPRDKAGIDALQERCALIAQLAELSPEAMSAEEAGETGHALCLLVLPEKALPYLEKAGEARVCDLVGALAATGRAAEAIAKADEALAVAGLDPAVQRTLLAAKVVALVLDGKIDEAKTLRDELMTRTDLDEAQQRMWGSFLSDTWLGRL